MSNAEHCRRCHHWRLPNPRWEQGYCWVLVEIGVGRYPYDSCRHWKKQGEVRGCG